jgi:hypothetical protein
MRVTMLLADSAQAVGGKLYILGGGWSIIGPEPTPMAIALKIEVPWHDTNRQHTLRITLLDEDGHHVQVPTPTGDQPFVIESAFEVGRPPGLLPGTPIDFPIALNIGPLPLPSNRRYVWRCEINGETNEYWQVSFATRPSQPPQPG